MSLKKNIRAYLAENPQHRTALEEFAAWCGARRPKSVPTLDQLARRAEFERMFKLIPGKYQTHKASTVCGVSQQTVRIWRCESAHRFPSWEHIENLKVWIETEKQK